MTKSSLHQVYQVWQICFWLKQIGTNSCLRVPYSQPPTFPHLYMNCKWIKNRYHVFSCHAKRTKNHADLVCVSTGGIVLLALDCANRRRTTLYNYLPASDGKAHGIKSQIIFVDSSCFRFISTLLLNGLGLKFNDAWNVGLMYIQMWLMKNILPQKEAYNG